MSLDNSLASEVLLVIAEHLTREKDINALVQTNRRLYSVLNVHLYQRNVRQSGSSAVIWGAVHGHESTVHKSLEAGGDVQATNRSGTYRSDDTALHLASLCGHLPIVMILIARGACVNAQTRYGYTPLHLAIDHRFELVALALLENGADISIQWPGVRGLTALHYASYLGVTLVVKYLLEKGEDIDVRDARLRTPLHWAIKTHEHHLWDFRRSVNVPRCSSILSSEPVRSDGTWRGDSGVVRLLLKSGANVNLRDRSGTSVQDLVKRHPSNSLRMIFNCGTTAALHERELRDETPIGGKRLKKEEEIIKETDSTRKSASNAVDGAQIAGESSSTREVKSTQGSGQASARLENAAQSVRDTKP